MQSMRVPDGRERPSLARGELGLGAEDGRREGGQLILGRGSRRGAGQGGYCGRGRCGAGTLVRRRAGRSAGADAVDGGIGRVAARRDEHRAGPERPQQRAARDRERSIGRGRGHAENVPWPWKNGRFAADASR